MYQKIIFIFFTAITLLCAQQRTLAPFAVNGTEQNRDGFSLSAKIEKAPELNVQTTKRISVGKALLFSLLIPGAGEYYAGNQFYAKIFFGIEVTGIAGMLFNNAYHQSLVDDYQSYAVLHAGVDPTGKNNQYWVNLGKFDDIYSYNERRLNQRRVNDIYAETEANKWRWDSFDNRYYYDFKRIKAAEVKSRNSYFYSAILINHLISAINAVRLARSHNRQLKTASPIKVTFQGYRPNDRYFGVSLFTRF